MSDFWAMSDMDKTLLVLKILLVGFGWGCLIFGAITVICFCMHFAKDCLERREERLKEEQSTGYSPKTDPQVAAFKLKQTRRGIRKEQDEFFRNVQELQDDLR